MAIIPNDPNIDNGKIIQDIINASPLGKIHIKLPAGVIYMVTPVLVDKDRIDISGEGLHITAINFTPLVTGDSAFTFGKKDGSVSYQCSMKNLSFSDVSRNNVQRTAIKLINTSQVVVDNVAIYPFTDTSKKCVGLQMNGRELTTIRNFSSSADRPIVVGINPNKISNTLEDCDQTCFTNLYLQPSIDNSCVFVEDGATLSTVTFDGYQAWVGGKYGLYWKNTISKISSFGVHIYNVRREQPKDSAAYAFYVDTEIGGNQNIKYSNCYISVGQNGVFHRGVKYSLFDNHTHAGSIGTTALNIDRSAYNSQGITISGCFWQRGSMSSVIGFNTQYEGRRQYIDMPLASHAVYSYW